MRKDWRKSRFSCEIDNQLTTFSFVDPNKLHEDICLTSSLMCSTTLGMKAKHKGE